jgi:hypothetical protein
MQLQWSSRNTPFNYPSRSKFSIRSNSVRFQNKSEELRLKYTNQPRLNPNYSVYYKVAKDFAPFFSGTLTVYNPFIFAGLGFNTVTLKGVITELGVPVSDRRVLVVLMTTGGDVVEKVYTDLEGNFIFYEIPENMNLMAVAVDATYKYNAVILSKILTVDNGV